MSNRALPILGVVAAGGVGYYLYTAGGDPKVAQKQASADAHKLEAKIESKLPHQNQIEARGKEAEARGESLARQAGNKIDNATAEGQKKYQDVKSEASSALHKTAAEANKAIDKFDAKVTEEASKAKSGLSSWFGGK